MQFMFNFYIQRVSMRIRFYLMSLALLSAQVSFLQAEDDLFNVMRQPGFGEKLANAQVGTERLKAAGFLIGSAILLGGAKHLHKSQMVKSFSETIGLDPQDAANVIGVSGSCAALSFIAGPEISAGLLRFAKRAPLAAILFKVTCSNTFQSIIKETPLIGPYLACPNLKCTGICSKCIMTKGITGIGLYFAVDQGINAYWN